MIIALYSIEYPPDPFSAGIGTYSSTLAKALVAKGHKVHIVTRGTQSSVKESSVENEQGVIVHRITPTRPELPSNFKGWQIILFSLKSAYNELRYRQNVAKKLEQLVKNEGVELVESAEYMAESLFYPSKRFAKIPFVVRLHTPFAYAERVEKHVPEIARLFIAWLERSLVHKATHITAPSLSAAQAFSKDLNISVNQVVLTINPPPKFDLENNLPDIKSEPNMILFVGRLNLWKGTHVLARALPIIRNAVPEAYVTFVGKDYMGLEGFSSVKQYLLSLVPSDHHQHMNFVGHVSYSQVESYLKKATVCVLPSLFDNFPYTCLEAMAYGKAIVGSINGGMRELLADGEAGLLYTPPNHEELAAHIIELLLDREKCSLLGKKAKMRALEHYNFEKVVEGTVEFYKEARTNQSGKL